MVTGGRAARIPSPLVDHPERLERGHPFRQWKTWRMPVGGLTLTGYSRANDKTFFHIPELGCALDAGLPEGRRVETVLLTHTHLDHAKDLDFLASRDGGVDIFVPAAALPYVSDYLRASTALNRVAGAGDCGARLHGVSAGQDVRFGARHVARVFECRHKVPCVGYGVAEIATVLTPEYDALRTSMVDAGRGAEFGRLVAGRRREGAVVDREVRRPLFAFLGDTDPAVFDENPELFDYPVVITECTYLDDALLDRARRVGHTVWSRLKPVVAAHPGTLFVLIHFSLRHGDREVLEFFRGEGHDNVLPWVHPGSLLPESHQPTGGR